MPLNSCCPSTLDITSPSVIPPTLTSLLHAPPRELLLEHRFLGLLPGVRHLLLEVDAQVLHIPLEVVNLQVYED